MKKEGGIERKYCPDLSSVDWRESGYFLLNSTRSMLVGATSFVACDLAYRRFPRKQEDYWRALDSERPKQEPVCGRVYGKFDRRQSISTFENSSLLIRKDLLCNLEERFVLQEGLFTFDVRLFSFLSIIPKRHDYVGWHGKKRKVGGDYVFEAILEDYGSLPESQLICIESDCRYLGKVDVFMTCCDGLIFSERVVDYLLTQNPDLQFDGVYING
jgi:hypothetical protein